jgi:site-specific DNA-methyltransferase (adenine-specific)
MQRIAASSVDMVLCDLPYGKTRNAWDKIIPIQPMWDAIRRVAKPTAAIVLMAEMKLAARLITSNEGEFRYDLVWHKNKPTGLFNANRMPMRQHETILVFYRSPPTFTPQKTQGHKPGNKAHQTSVGQNYGATDKAKVEVYGGNTDRFPTSVIPIPIINNDDAAKVHPTQKPVALMEWLVRSYTQPGDTVLDFCAGSGTTGVAAVHQRRDFIGIDLLPEYTAIAADRLYRTLPMLAAE